MKFKSLIKKWLLHFPYFKFYFLRKELRVTRRSTFTEADLIQLFFKYFSNKKVMLDVGAHFGGSFSFYEKMGWKVYAFEPDPANRKRIKPQLQSTEIFDTAITETGGDEKTLYTSEESTGISSLASFHPSHKPSVKVKTMDLKTFCREKEIKKIDFLKIDTEGYDLFVLKGFPFERISPMVILCEFEDNKTLSLGYSYKDLGGYLISKGYDVYISEWYPIIKYGVQHTWRMIEHFPEHKLVDGKGWGNFIAIRSGYAHEFKNVIKAYLDSLRN